MITPPAKFTKPKAKNKARDHDKRVAQLSPIVSANANYRALWLEELAQGIDNAADLLAAVKLDAHSFDRAGIAIAEQKFATRVPWDYVNRIKARDPRDPLLLQVLPQGIENIIHPQFSADPVADTKALKLPGLLHKYQSRVLLLATGVCAVNCRFCFRRNLNYQQLKLSKNSLQAALDYINDDHSIEEVILSGGDPLMQSNAKLTKLITKLEKIKHLQRLRIHSRLPIVLPSRIDENLCALFANSRFELIMVTHANHGNEISPSVIEAMTKLKQADLLLLNQSVLLKNINDDAKVLIELSRALIKAGILPYYLHLLDRAAGTAHFECSKKRAIAIVEKMRQSCSGYMVPRLAVEIAHRPHKTLLA